ncbi:MAG: HPr family phosphocarrier protein [Treponema sp.]|nr:HPr family phosphocarrier protein [Treponema sp.]
MKQFNYTITDELGIHARPGGELVKLAKQFSSTIKVDCNGKSADAKRLIAVMSLGAKQGHAISITCEGEDEDTAIAKLEEFFKNSL